MSQPVTAGSPLRRSLGLRTSAPRQVMAGWVPPDGAKVVLEGSELAVLAAQIGEEISRTYPQGVLLVGVLKGSVLFMADLVRTISVPVEVDFLGISTYAEGTGRVRITKDLDYDIFGRDVVLVEDIVDTGLTCAYLLGELRRRGPATVEVCALFDRQVRRIVPVSIRFRGVDALDDLLLGYGLDVGGRYRNLPFVTVGSRQTLVEDVDAYVKDLYGR